MNKFILVFLLLITTCFSFSQNITLEPFASGFTSPVDLQSAGDDRLFVAELGGLIKILNADGTTNATPFLDISALMGTGSEKGLLGLAFHPDYANNGYFFVYYINAFDFTQISRYSVSAGDPNVADPTSELRLIDYEQPFRNHNGGCMHFGPDGYLYISSGDGGNAGDPGNRAQNTEILLGKILRIDVDNPSGGRNYGIPPDNPFANDPPNAPEIWAYGLRNAWKFSFDSLTGDIWIADVGQATIEEINKAPGTEPGLNYGWRCYEGTLPFNTTDCPDPSELTFPVAEYPHPDGVSVTGGYVYRGTLQENMIGYYFAADFVRGLIVTVDPDNNFTNLGIFPGNWSTFGQDVNGELYIVNYNGEINKIIGEKLGVDDLQTAVVSLFPNPAEDRVTIQTYDELLDSVQILDLKGSILYSEENIANQSKVIQTEDLSGGIYLVRINTENGTAVEKLIIR